MIDKGRIEFDDFNTALWAMAFAASGLGQAALFAGDVAKANTAMKSIFATLDSNPEIASEPWEDRGKADMKTSLPKERALKEEMVKDGTVELSKVNFAYPTRKAAKIFNEIDLTIPAGKAVALVSGFQLFLQEYERLFSHLARVIRFRSAAVALARAQSSNCLKGSMTPFRTRKMSLAMKATP